MQTPHKSQCPYCFEEIYWFEIENITKQVKCENCGMLINATDFTCKHELLSNKNSGNCIKCNGYVYRTTEGTFVRAYSTEELTNGRTSIREQLKKYIGKLF